MSETMKNEVFGAANVVRCELLDTFPGALDHTIQDVTRRLLDMVMCEVEKGELICSLQNVEQRQLYDLNSVEISRKVKLKRLVRCKDCIHFDPFRPTDGFCKISGMINTLEFFCADGRGKEQSNG